MPSILKKQRAELDLFDIWIYVAADNPDKADAFLDMFEEKFNLLAHSPMMGRERTELSKSIRSFPVGNYLVFYQPIEGGIDTFRVLLSARDIPLFDSLASCSGA